MKKRSDKIMKLAEKHPIAYIAISLGFILSGFLLIVYLDGWDNVIKRLIGGVKCLFVMAIIVAIIVILNELGVIKLIAKYLAKRKADRERNVKRLKFFTNFYWLAIQLWDILEINATRAGVEKENEPCDLIFADYKASHFRKYHFRIRLSNINYYDSNLSAKDFGDMVKSELKSRAFGRVKVTCVPKKNYYKLELASPDDFTYGLLKSVGTGYLEYDSKSDCMLIKYINRYGSEVVTEYEKLRIYESGSFTEIMLVRNEDYQLVLKPYDIHPSKINRFILIKERKR